MQTESIANQKIQQIFKSLLISFLVCLLWNALQRLDCDASHSTHACSNSSHHNSEWYLCVMAKCSPQNIFKVFTLEQLPAIQIYASWCSPCRDGFLMNELQPEWMVRRWEICMSSNIRSIEGFLPLAAASPAIKNIRGDPHISTLM